MTKRGRHQRGRFNKQNKKPKKKQDDDFGEWVYTNEDFVKYYQAQQIVAPDEWEAFMKFLATPLPTTFRINNSCAFAERIRERIAKDFHFEGLTVDDEPVDPIAEMPWYPNHKGFQWSVERRRIRKLPLLADFQKWLIELSDSGSITRQEAVSMIPPLILDVASDHKVLDMCAAPGSKTSQLLESLHAQEHATGELPTGMVMANDVDLKRAYMLVHQSKRMSSPSLLVTCHEAQHLPSIGSRTDGFFDRVLCDAPCSGDGTLRKNPIIWKQWNAKNGMTLHPLQLQIAKRGATLLKTGGYMCYSTCTFNPLENEAVVAELLRWSNGALELVDVSDRLPLLPRRPGKSSWKVMDASLNEYATYADFNEQENKDAKIKVLPTMFPPTDEEAATFHLERCMRCVPQDANTGGFFICLLKKTAPILDENEKDEPEQVQEPAKPKRERPSKNKGEEYVAFSKAQWEGVRKDYDMDQAFPKDQLMTRSEESKSVTFVTKAITMELIQQLRAQRVKIVYTGLKIFERNDAGDGNKVYRLSQAGVRISLPFLRSRRCQIPPADMQLLLERHGDLLSFSDFEPATQKTFEDAALGSIICSLDRAPTSLIEKMVLNIAVWRGKSSMTLMATKADAQAMLGAMRELGLYDDHVHARIQEAKQQAQQAKDQEVGEEQVQIKME